LILREEHRLRVFENRVLRRIFGPKRDEVTGEWRKLHNEELHDLFSGCSHYRYIPGCMCCLYATTFFFSVEPVAPDGTEQPP
jgi:hypothetical protein